MKTLNLKSPKTGHSFAREHAHNARSEAMEPQPYVSWGDHPQAFRPNRLTDPCIPCCCL